MEISPGAKLWQLNWGLDGSAADAHRHQRRPSVLGRQRLLRALGRAPDWPASASARRSWSRSPSSICGSGCAGPMAATPAALALLILVEFVGSTGMGAQRWIDIGVDAAAAVGGDEDRVGGGTGPLFQRRRYRGDGPICVRLVPASAAGGSRLWHLVVKQPDLGTALILVMVGGVMFWLAGVRLWQVGLVADRRDRRGARWSGNSCTTYQKATGVDLHQSRKTIRWGRVTISCSPRSPWGRGGCQRQGIHGRGRRAISTSCRRSRPTLFSPCWPRNSACWGR